MKRILLIFCCCVSGVVCANDLRLWYNTPARVWMDEALPIGNGYMGAMFFGGTSTDCIQIAEEGIWAGGPGANKNYWGGNRKDAWKYLDRVRGLLADGKMEEARQLSSQLTGEIVPGGVPQYGDFGAQQPFGSLWVTVEKKDTLYTDYKRSLDIDNAIGEVTYKMGGTTFRNEYFASYPARLIVCRYANDAAGGENYTIALTSPHQQTNCRAEGKDQLLLAGKLSSNQEAFEGIVRIKTDGKSRGEENGTLKICGAKYVEVYVSVASAYRNHFPDYTGNDFHRVNRQAMERASRSGYEQLKEAHRADYTALFRRVAFELEGDKASDLPTDRRLLLYSRGAYDPLLETLYFQYGRYLLISSSRPGTLPAHLQGKWNESMNPAWACDYHLNINLQMIYWPAEMTNLSECHEPLLEYIDKLLEPGRITAREYFNARGWSVHTMNNVYGYTAPGWDFNWGYAPNSAAWLCRHLWEHFCFTGDRQFLQGKAYPILREVGEFWLDYLCRDKDGTLVSSPSYSPEHGDIAVGATIDQEIAWDLFSNLMAAADYIPTDPAFTDTIRRAREQLSPLKIGRYGQLQEWKEDVDDPADEHRHVSHLYALYPGNQITAQTTPRLAEAARRTLVYRGEGGTGWSLAWKINFWARLRDGNQAYKMLRNLLTPSVGEGRRSSGSGSYHNLLCAHPPFQLDGNMGAVAGIAELLLQSHAATIDLLPALPVCWHTGHIKGLKARGGYTVDMDWKDGFLQCATITASQAGQCKVTYQGITRDLTFRAGESQKIEMK
ncbi:MAG: glycoside hydrolase family 95 protein [Odoribacter sp.]